MLFVLLTVFYKEKWTVLSIGLFDIIVLSVVAFQFAGWIAESFFECFVEVDIVNIAADNGNLLKWNDSLQDHRMRFFYSFFDVKLIDAGVGKMSETVFQFEFVHFEHF